jgi:hypothetical protein
MTLLETVLSATVTAVCADKAWVIKRIRTANRGTTFFISTKSDYPRCKNTNKLDFMPHYLCQNHYFCSQNPKE